MVVKVEKNGELSKQETPLFRIPRSKEVLLILCKAGEIQVSQKTLDNTSELIIQEREEMADEVRRLERIRQALSFYVL